MTTYRDEIRQLKRLATREPWTSDGDLYGVRTNGLFVPLGIRQILTILDATDGASASYLDSLAELDRTTTPPWDPGHLVLGMELDAGLRSSRERSLLSTSIAPARDVGQAPYEGVFLRAASTIDR